MYDTVIFIVFVVGCKIQVDNAYECYILDTFAECSYRNLSRIPWNLPNNITVLNLSGNAITDLGEKNLSRYKQLIELRLDSNKVRNIRSEAFEGLFKLKILSLAENKLKPTSFMDDTFVHLKTLEELYLHKNLHNASRLLMFCHKRVCEYSDIAFSVLTNLQKLSLDLCEDPRFGRGFLELRKLKSLIFDNCLACDLNNSTFQNFSNSNITELNLSNCEQFKPSPNIQTGILNPFPNLKSLDLSKTYFGLDNALRLLHPFKNKTMNLINFHSVSSMARSTPGNPFKVTITKEMMKYLKTICVKTLILSKNGIVDAKPESLLSYDHPECFENIIFSGNSFTLEYNKLYLEALRLAHNVVNLKLFDYSYVPIHFLHKHFILPPKLKIPTTNSGITQNCRIQDEVSGISGNLTFSIPRKLESIRLSHVMSEAQVQNLILKGTDSLKFLDLSYFQMVSFPYVYLPDRFKLKYLDMSGIDAKMYLEKTIPIYIQNVETIVLREANLDQMFREGKNVFVNLRNITKTIDVSYNHLDVLPLNFKSISNLQNLNLSFNSFTNVPKQLLSAENLKSLDMRFNSLYSIDKRTRNWLDSLVKKHNRFSLHIQGNLFACSCENRAFIAWLFTSKVSFDFSKNYSCRLDNGSISTTSEVIIQFHDLFSDCDAIIWLHIGVICIVSSFVLIGLSTIIYQFRWRITYYFYRKLKVNFLNKQIETDFDYDVFVAYAFDAETWLIDTLIPKLEIEWKLKLCLKDRDFPIGGDRGDTIINAIQQSKRILFIITPGFHKRIWGRFEIEMAKYEMFFAERRERNIIVIMKDNTRKDDVPVEIGKIWKNITMINWPLNEICTDNVWNDLKFQLN